MSQPFTNNILTVCRKPNPEALLRLFCFPYAGGGATVYRDWYKKLDPSIEVWAVQYPGRGALLKEKPYEEMLPLIKAAAHALLPLLDKPFVFFGHSMGALVSFELTHYIRKYYGLEPVHLFISGRGAPHIADENPPIHHLPETEFLKELERYNGTPKEILENRGIMKLVLPTIRADFAVCETYSYIPKPSLNCPISVFNGIRDNIVNLKQLEGWREYTKSTFKLKIFNGDHFFINTEKGELLETIFKELIIRGLIGSNFYNW